VKRLVSCLSPGLGEPSPVMSLIPSSAAICLLNAPQATNARDLPFAPSERRVTGPNCPQFRPVGRAGELRPQHDAGATVFGLTSGPAPDRC
jgi:hypothetical protein